MSSVFDLVLLDSSWLELCIGSHGCACSYVLCVCGPSMCLAGALVRDHRGWKWTCLLDPGMLGPCVFVCSVMLSPLLDCRQPELTSGSHWLLPGSDPRPTGELNTKH